MDLSHVNIIAELERIEWPFEVTGDWVKCKCPAHDDENPSCGVSISDGAWKCYACGKAGDFVAFLAFARQANRQSIVADLASRYPIEGLIAVDGALVEEYHQQIWQAEHMRAQLYNRGLNDDLIRKYRLGYHNGRITIPVYDGKHRFINIRFYLPGAPGPEKMRNLKNHGRALLFPIDQLRYEKIIVCGGECKAIVMAYHMNQFGYGAITATGAEGAWDASLTALLEDKETWTCTDIDDPGRKAASRVNALLRVNQRVRSTHDIMLPLDRKKHPKGDINDYFGVERHTAEEMLQLIEMTPPWEPTASEAIKDERPQPVHLSDVSKSQYANRRLKTIAVTTGVFESTYLVPHKTLCVCSKDTKFCSVCPVYTRKPEEEFTIGPEDPAILDMVNAGKEAQKNALMRSIGVPDGCRVCKFDSTDFHKVEDIRLTPQLSMSSRSSDRVIQSALHVGHGMELNTSYELTGRVYPHPKDQSAVFLVSSATASTDALDAFSPARQDVQALQDLFSPKEWTIQALEDKLDEIYEDLEANVTRIYRRRDLHLMTDLAYHSPLVMTVDDRHEKGWVEVLVVGDSSQGKTETTTHLMRHYGLGERTVCKSASVAGLLGGVQQFGTKYFISWGVIPQNDRKLVILEELKGASVEVISKLTDMRSSGIAEIPKIERRRTHARTRLIAISNARHGSISSSNYGVEAVRDLIGNLEDIRRFDAAMAVASEQVPRQEIAAMQRERPIVEHRFSADACRLVVLWSWTRLPDHVRVPHTAIADAADRLTNRYSEDIPLVDPGSMRLKIARLAASIACRTMSTDDGINLVIRDCHVEFVEKFLTRCYDDKFFGYNDYSRARKAASKLSDEVEIRKRLFATPYAVDVIDQFICCAKINLNDICDWTNYDRGEGVRFLSYLVRKYALKREDRFYVKTPGFIDLLKRLQHDPQLKALEVPDHVDRQPEF